MTDVADTLRRLVEEEARRAQAATVAETLQRLQGQPTPPAPTGGVTANPEAVADLRDNRIPAATVGFADTATFGTSDELAGLFAGGLIPGYGYAEARDDARATQADMQERAPGSYLLGQVGGGLTTGLAVAGPVDDFLRGVRGLGGSGLLPRMGRGAAAGAGEGLAYGIGSGEGTRDRIAQALTYGGVGGAIGGALPPVSELAHYLALRPIGAATGVGNQTRAGNTVARAVEDAGMSLDQVDDGLRVAASEGQPEFAVADVLGLSGQRALSGVARQPGPGRTFADATLNFRQNNQTTRLAQFVEEAMDARNTRAQQTAAATAERGAAGNVNYGAARANAQPVDVRGVLAAIDDQIGPMRNTTIAGEGVDARLDGIRRRLAGTLTENGEVMSAEMSDLSRLIRLYGEIGDDIQAATRAGRGFEAGQLRNVQSALGEALEEASPDWRSANANFAGASRVVEAPDAGRRLNTGQTRSPDVADEWSNIEARINRIPGLTDAERAQYIEEARQGFRIGYADGDLAAIGNARMDTRNMAGSLFNNQRQIDNYNLMANDPDLFFRRVGRESTMADTRFLARGGSGTAENFADNAMADGADIGIAANLLSGNLGAATAQLAGRGLNAARGSNEATREMVARALLSSNPGELQRLLSSSQRNQSVNRIVAAMLRGGLREPIGGPVAQAVAPR